jgi:uncharacterized protein YndB with AHSA1/START domain
MRLRAKVAAPIDVVWHALTDATHLRSWLAEYAEVDLPRHRYEFWGRHTPDGATPHQELLQAEDHTLRFSWLVDGVVTEVGIGLADKGPFTAVTLTQSNMPSWERMLADDGPLSALHTFWALSIANLADHVEGRALTPKVDFTSPDMRAEFVIGAPADKVYEALVDPDRFTQWFGARVEIEPHVGGRWSMGGFDTDPDPAKILDLQPNHKVAIAWPDGVVSTWELEGSDTRTRLTFVQSGFDDERPPYASWTGWLGGFAELRRYLEIPDWRPLWLEVTVEGVPEGMITIEPQEV